LAKVDRLQESQFIDLYGRLSSSPNLSKANLALTRWNSAVDRLREEDNLIDYWVALESLFVPDSTQELSYRAPLRIAAFLGETGSERERIYNEMRDSYKLRSEIVHGSIQKKKGRGKRKLSLSEITNLTGSYLRQALITIMKSDKQFNAVEIEAGLLRKE
jgi:hypothetical protein